ncbi:cistern family PEP-CTERM protein [Crocosphaera sp. UHCC 0190]|uniref:cistern family PEP-CTERM protein n=1 Tax=Crocosphaera sp. UHCC 0190 TaxID=3110246 RepID=UPI002B208CBD|nr:cistern family PEP-CTERM protein [Crocosphaera sp. UHCC 0190]MEA5511739.1 cistern family PEP-CTERM protein [Crocosphaera sp. UHCC 0190]
MKNATSTLIGTSLLAAGLAIGMTSNASALTISNDSVTDITAADIGQSFTVKFNGNVATQDVAGLTSEATFTLVNFNNSGALFSIALTNTSSGGIGSRVSSLGFNTDPVLTGATSTGIFDIAVRNGAYPNGFGPIGVCFKAGGGTSNCQGGGGGGVPTGNTGNFTVALNFAPGALMPPSSLSLSNFGVRYQSITGTNLGNSGTGTGTPVPEPLTILGASAAVGFGGAFKRKLAQAKKKDKNA